MINYDKANKKTMALTAKVSELSAKYVRLEAEHNKIRQALDSTLHEIRRFSNEISNYAEILSKQLKQRNVDSYLQELCETVLHTSGMISSRLGFTDLELNPASVSLQLPLRAGLYKKFEKAQHVLALKARLRRVSVRFVGSSYMEIEALPSFELVPFVILDNAIKYSPPDQEVTVQFDEHVGKWLSVEVTSTGPIVEPSEVSAIFDRGFRGCNAHKLSVAGEGLGLFLAKFLCDYHDIKLSAASKCENVFEIGGVPYGQFCIRLQTSR